MLYFFNKPLDKMKLAQNEAYLKEKKWQADLVCLVPLTMVIPYKDDKLLVFVDYALRKRADDFSGEFFDKNFDILNVVRFTMKKEDFEKLKNDKGLFAEVKSYLNEYIVALEAKRADLVNSFYSENDILDFLRDNKDYAKKLKDLLDKELAHIKANHPDIVASWKFYNEFEKICEYGLSSNEMRDF